MKRLQDNAFVSWPLLKWPAEFVHLPMKLQAVRSSSTCNPSPRRPEHQQRKARSALVFLSHYATIVQYCLECQYGQAKNTWAHIMMKRWYIWCRGDVRCYLHTCTCANHSVKVDHQHPHTDTSWGLCVTRSRIAWSGYINAHHLFNIFHLCWKHHIWDRNTAERGDLPELHLNTQHSGGWAGFKTCHCYATIDLTYILTARAVMFCWQSGSKMWEPDATGSISNGLQWIHAIKMQHAC